MKVRLPTYAHKLLRPKRYKTLYGGRGSSKSHTIARMLILKGKKQKLRILCAREFQNSIKDSVHKLLSDVIEEYKLQDHYTVLEKSIIGANGTEFIFKGLHGSLMSIKSMEGIDILWLEEAQTVSKLSWDVLVPTIRKEGSEIWSSFNPENETDPTQMKFIDENFNPINNSEMLTLKVNWEMNPWLSDVLKKRKIICMKLIQILQIMSGEAVVRRIVKLRYLKASIQYSILKLIPRGMGRISELTGGSQQIHPL